MTETPNMAGSVRLIGYAIVSADGMIADSDGRMPPSLIFEADQSFYRQAVNDAALVVHGRNSAEPGSDARMRPRVVVTRTIPALAVVRPEPAILRWNPAGMPFVEVLRVLGIGDGIVAIVGGAEVFDLFLGIGYDAFHLTRATKARLPGGRPLFRAVPAHSPEDILTAAGLRLRRECALEPGLTLSSWERTPARRS